MGGGGSKKAEILHTYYVHSPQLKNVRSDSISTDSKMRILAFSVGADTLKIKSDPYSRVLNCLQSKSDPYFGLKLNRWPLQLATLIIGAECICAFSILVNAIKIFQVAEQCFMMEKKGGHTSTPLWIHCVVLRLKGFHLISPYVSEGGNPSAKECRIA